LRQQKENVVERGFVVAVAGAAIVVAGMTGCSSSNKQCSGGTCQSVGQASAKLTIDGKDQTVPQPVTCQTSPQGGQIGMGNPQDPTNLDVAQFSPTDVQQMSLNSNGKKLSVQNGNLMGGSAKMTKDGNKYTFTGKAAEAPDPSNPMAATNPTTHDFTLEVTCP
jgi:ipoprotein LpqH